MDIEEVKEELQLYRGRYQEIQAVRDNITFIKSGLSIEPLSTLQQLQKLVELYEKLHQLSYTSTCCNVELLTMIALLDDPTSRTILIQRYVECKSLEDILRIMNISKSTYQRWHEKAVKDLCDFLKDEPK